MADSEVIRYLIGVTPGVKLLTPDPGGVRMETVNDWASLTEGEGLRPQPGEWLMKIARFLQDGQTWTWVGVYRHAFQLGGRRPGGILGAGLLLRNAYVQGSCALNYLTGVAATLEQAALVDGKFTRKIEDLRDFPWDEHDRILRGGLIQSEPGEDYGLDPARADQAYIDLSNPGDEVFASWYVEWAQVGRPFAGFGRLLLGSSARITENAQKLSNIAAFTSHEFATASFAWMQDAPLAAATVTPPAPAAPAPDPSPGAYRDFAGSAHEGAPDTYTASFGAAGRHKINDDGVHPDTERERALDGSLRRAFGKSEWYRGMAWGAVGATTLVTTALLAHTAILLSTTPGSGAARQETVESNAAAVAGPAPPTEQDRRRAGQVAVRFANLLERSRLSDLALLCDVDGPGASELRDIYGRLSGTLGAFQLSALMEDATADADGSVIVPIRISTGLAAPNAPYVGTGSVTLRRVPSEPGTPWKILRVDLPSA